MTGARDTAAVPGERADGRGDRLAHGHAFQNSLGPQRLKLCAL